MMAKTFKWVADGFCLTDERALDMLANDLQYAYAGTELKAKVINHPDRMRVLKAFGISKARIEAALKEMPDADNAQPNDIFDFIWKKGKFASLKQVS